MKTIKNGGYVSWGETNYIIPTKTGLKEYYVSKTNYNGPFGTKNVLSFTVTEYVPVLSL